MKPDLGRVGLWAGQLGTMPAADARDVIARVDDLGFPSVWINESLAKHALVHAATILGWNERLVIATGIANIWARDAAAMINGARTITEAFGPRFVLGIGVSHAPAVARRGHHYRRPLSAMRDYLDAMEAAQYDGPPLPADPPVLIGALGPRMLELSATRTQGAHPYFLPVAHTRVAREQLGPEPLLAPEQVVLLERDPDRARDRAREHVARYLAATNYANGLRRLGWEEQHLTDGGSDELIDALVAWGDPEDIAARVAERHAAGADHVAVQVLGRDRGHLPLEDVQTLAGVLL